MKLQIIKNVEKTKVITLDEIKEKSNNYVYICFGNKICDNQITEFGILSVN